MPLKRVLTLRVLTFYGLGTIIGAGIYALIGEVSHISQQFTPIAFLVASVIAGFTGMSYAELCSRFPHSAGSALYVKKAFNKNALSGMMGWLVFLTGLISAATLTHGFVNYVQVFIPLPSYVAIALVIIVLGLITAWGISESAILIVIMTLLEISGLLLIIFYGRNSFSHADWQQMIPSFNLKDWSTIVSGAFLAFYAFIGFEDMVNVAEETIKPERTIPYAIFLALLGATILYLLVAFVTIQVIPQEELLNSKVPLTLLIQSQGHSPVLFGLIALFAIMNGIMVQIIMASRLMYGMASQNMAPKIFSYVNQKTQTPLLSTAVVLLAILFLAYGFPIQTLARATSTVMLIVFGFVQLSLIVIKFKKPKEKNAISLPLFFPIAGLLFLISFLILQIVMP